MVVASARWRRQLNIGGKDAGYQLKAHFNRDGLLTIRQGEQCIQIHADAARVLAVYILSYHGELA